MSASTSAMVTTGQTTEVTLDLVCGGPGNGGLDVVVTAEHSPTITGLAFNPNKFVTVCEPVSVTVTASSPDNLPLTYSWTTISTPPGAPTAAVTDAPPQLPPGVSSLIVSLGNTATIDTATTGDYLFTVTVSDTNGLSASLTFPVHVLAGNGCAPLANTGP
jgi:hypothetical protein